MLILSVSFYLWYYTVITAIDSEIWSVVVLFLSLEHNNGRNSYMGTTHSDSSQGKLIQLVVCA